jgi:glycosyltransferase involved in cell wall biosynthesis
LRPRVSVVVAALAAQSQLDGLLGFLDAQTLPRREWELIVVDDGSPVPLRAEGADRVLRIDTPEGPYAARNRGLEAAGGGCIAITDADCRPRPDWLEAMVKALDGADMAAGAIHVTVGESPGVAERIDAARNLDQRSYANAGFAAFANFGCRRAVIDAVGRFNGRLVSNGDREFCMRATHAGFSLAYAPDAVVDHSALRGPRAVAARAFRLGRGRAQTTRHGHGPARQRRRNWLPLRSYLPFAATGLADYVFVGLPLVAGYAVGAVEARLARGSVTSQPRSAKSLTRAARARRTRR